MTTFRFVATPLLLLSLFALASASLQEVCTAATKNSDFELSFCEDTLKNKGDDYYNLAVAATGLSKDTFEGNLAKIQQLLQKGGLDKPSERALRACDNVYNRGLDKLKQATTKLTSKDYYGASNYLSTSRDEAVSCGDVFTKFGIESLLKDENDKALKLSYLAIHIAQNLK